MSDDKVGEAGIILDVHGTDGDNRDTNETWYRVTLSVDPKDVFRNMMENTFSPEALSFLRRHLDGLHKDMMEDFDEMKPEAQAGVMALELLNEALGVPGYEFK